MRRAVALILTLCLTSAPAVEIRYTATEKAACDEQGGCITVTRQAVVDMVRAAHVAALLRCGVEL